MAVAKCKIEGTVSDKKSENTFFILVTLNKNRQISMQMQTVGSLVP
jgi:hypothetical protein